MNHFSMLLGLNENSDLILRWTQAGFSLDYRCFGDYADSRAGSSDQPCPYLIKAISIK